MSNSTTKAYECSRQNAKVVISNSEWVNDFSDGIKLEKGDSVRLLGSFVNEASSGEEIEVTDEMEVNIQYSTFLKGQTFFTADKGTDLIDLGKIGDIPYSTDSFGIEPPGWWFNDGQATTGSVANRGTSAFTFDASDNNLYENPYATGTGKVSYNTGGAQWTSQNNFARTWGTNIKTYSDNQNTASLNESHIYTDWSNFSCTNELYIAGLVKKLILPVLDKSITSLSVNGGSFDFEDLVSDPPIAGEGMLAGVPRPGMCIATADIAGATGLFDEDGNGYFETDAPCGKVNLTSGVQSVIGEILAVRPVKYMIREVTTDCFELLVYNWVSPASINPKPLTRNNLDGTKLSTPAAVGSLVNTATQITGNAFVNCIVQTHGSGEKENGYNTNSTFNNINGSVNLGATVSGAQIPNNANSQMAGVPDVWSYDRMDASVSSIFPNVGKGIEKFKLSCLDSNLDDYKIGISKPQGLSFLYNGSYGSQLRYPKHPIPSPNPHNYYHRYRAQSNCVLSRSTCVYPSYLEAHIAISDNVNNSGTGLPLQSTEVETPPCVGGFIICKPETMTAIMNGTYTRIDEGRADGRIARWWWDYSYQYQNSKYSERHYKDNCHTQTALAAADAPGTNGFDGPYQSVLAGTPASDENKYNLEMCGKPQSQNWRLIGQPGFNEPYNTGLMSGYGFFFASGTGGVDTTAPLYIGDGGGNIMSTQEGVNANQWLQKPAGGYTSAHFGCPFERATYETTVNSVHFQDKSTGDCELGLDWATGAPNGDYFKYTLVNILLNLSTVALIQCLDENNIQTPVVGSLFLPQYDNIVNRKDVTITVVTPTGIPGQFNVTLSHAVDNCAAGHMPAGQVIFLSPTTVGSITGAGTEALPWAGDMLMVRENIAKYKVKSGFYTQEQLANVINDKLHYPTDKYKKEFSVTNQVPTNVGKLEQAFSSQNTVIKGNFVHTYIPDLNYGFTPVTTTNATQLDLTASTKEMTDELYTYEIVEWPVGVGTPHGFRFYHLSELPAYNGTTVRKVTDNPTDYPTFTGTHMKLYSIPYMSYDRVNPQIHLFRMKGGALNMSDLETNAGPPESFKRWDLKDSRFVGYYEGLRDLRTHATPANPTEAQGSAYSYAWRTRLNRNLLSYGGAAKIFVGANNFTLSFVEETNRFSLNNLYTPIRPHLSENPVNTAFGIDDAVPSAIVGSELTGNLEDMLSGIYINKLNGDLITREAFGYRWFDNMLVDTISADTLALYTDNFLESLGYPNTQAILYNNSFNNENDLYIFNGVNYTDGTAIRVGSKITPSINGSNPFANDCTLVAPVQQYFVEVDTDDFFADNAPTKGRNPYYYIGSDFPAKEFFGNDNGSKLPVIGICARNFHSFNFAFDLGASSITYTIDEDITITSLRTAIYTSDLKAPQNLSKFSSIIYLITKNNYFKSLTSQQDLVAKSQLIQSNYSSPYNPFFYNPAPFNYRTAPPPPGFIPQSYYINEGIPPSIPMEEDYDNNDEDLDFD
mgnify:FL=1